MNTRTPLNRRGFLKTAGVASAALSTSTRASARPAPPNVLVIVTDQQSAHMMSCTGNPWLDTLAMDALAQTGMRFERAYSANPVCVPARFSFQTGHYPSAAAIRHNGTPPDQAAVSRLAKQALGQVFRNAGYETAYAGKVHLPGVMRNVKTCGYENVLTGDQRDELANACVAFLHKKHEKPFLLFASFINPHDICYMAIHDLKADALDGNAPQGRNGKKRIAELRMVQALARPDGVSEEAFFRDHCPPLPKNHAPANGEPEAIQYLLDEREFRKNVRENWTDKRWREHRWGYCRLTERVDGQIGRVMAALRQAGLEENTIVLFTSDHGDNDASHKLEHKTVFYEEAARIPLLVRVPGMTRPGAVDDRHLISNGLDLLPTLCDLCDVPPPEGLKGRSLRPLLEGKKPKAWREALLVENQLGFMAHSGRYKFMRYDQCESREEFSDLLEDPGETKNHINDPKYAAEIRRHRRWLGQLLREHGKQEIEG